MSYTRILRWVLVLGLSLVFFIPFILADGSLVPNMFFPYITGKNFVFRVVVEILAGVYVLLALKEPRFRPKSSLILWAVAAFTLWMAIATVASVDPIKSFWSNFERMEGYITVLHLFVYFIVVGAVMSAEEWWEKFFFVSVGASVIMGVYALLQALHVVAISSQSGARADTTFGNAAYLGVYMLFNAFITILLLVRYRKLVYMQSLLGLALVLQVSALYFTQTRGALLGLIIGVIVAALYVSIFAKQREWRGVRLTAIYGLGAIALLVILFFALRTTPIAKTGTLSRLYSISLSDPTTASRFTIWHMALQGAAERPIAGWGQENFSYVFNKYYAPSMYGQEQWFDRAHNQFLDWLIAGGIPAFILYILLFGLMAYMIMTKEQLSTPEKGIILGLLAGYAFNNMFLFDDLISSVYFFTILAFVHAFSKRDLHKRLFMSRAVHDQGIAIAAPIIAVGTVLCVWSLNAPGIARAQNLLTAILTQVPNGQGGAAAKDPKQNTADFKVALSNAVWPGGGLGVQETTEQLLQFSSGQAQSSSVDPAVKKDTFDLAESAATALNKQRQHDARLELFFGAFYEAFGQRQQAITYLTKALEDSPKKQQIQFELGIANLNNGNIPGAVELFKKAYDEEPKYKDARIMYAIALNYSGDTNTADQLLMTGPKEQGFGTIYVDDARILQAYTNTKRFDRVIMIWKNRVAANPNDAQTIVGLAAAYFAAGDKANTIATLQSAEKINPAMAGQIEAIIKQIQSGALKPGQQ